MIKDSYLHQEFSDFGGEDIQYIINSKLYTANITEDSEGFFSRTKSGFYILEQEVYEENAYPYQGLLINFILSNKLTDTILVDNKSGKSVLTIVKDKKPIISSLLTSTDAATLEEQIKRMFITYNLKENTEIINIDQSKYNTSAILTQFLAPDEILQKQKLIIVKPILSILSLLFLSWYCFTSIPSTLENNNLNKEITNLQAEKQKLISRQIQLKQSENTISYQNLYTENKQTEHIIKQINNLIKKEPILEIVEINKDTKNSVIVKNYSPRYRENLKNLLSKVSINEKGLLIIF